MRYITSENYETLDDADTYGLLPYATDSSIYLLVIIIKNENDNNLRSTFHPSSNSLASGNIQAEDEIFGEGYFLLVASLYDWIIKLQIISTSNIQLMN